MTQFATYDQYALRYGPADQERVEAVLRDVSGAMLSAFEAFHGIEYAEGVNRIFDREAEAVCCEVAHRALDVPDGLDGASQYSQTAGAYSASVTMSSPIGDIWIGRGKLSRLGLAGQRVGCLMPLSAGR